MDQALCAAAADCGASEASVRAAARSVPMSPAVIQVTVRLATAASNILTIATLKLHRGFVCKPKPVRRRRFRPRLESRTEWCGLVRRP